MREKYYFLSDAHMGCRAIADEKTHEKRFVDWLTMAAKDATAIYLLGDIFDFWFEYRATVPKGYTLLLGKLREITESGIPIHFLVGNHDMWTFGYLEQECGLTVHKQPIVETLCGKTFFMAHGDGLGDQSKAFWALRTVFNSKACQWMFRTFVPPMVGLEFGYRWSKRNRLKHMGADNRFRGEENEPLVRFAKAHALENGYDFYLFGHRHILLNMMLSSGSQLAILGDFIEEFSYATYNGEQFCIENFE